MQRQYGSEVAPPHFYEFKARVAGSADTDADADADGGDVLGGRLKKAPSVRYSAYCVCAWLRHSLVNKGNIDYLRI
jgi:hypothetical protein